MILTKEFVMRCRNVGAMRDFLCQAIDQVDAMEEERRWRKCSDEMPSADEGYFLVLWDDGFPDIGYIGAEDGVIETVRDLRGVDSVKWWMPLPKAPEEYR